MSRRRSLVPQMKAGEELLHSYDNMVSVDGSRKMYCIGCGCPRAVEYAERVPCSACGALGTQRYQPLYDEFGEVLPAEVVLELRAKEAAERAVLRAQRAAEKLAAEPSLATASIKKAVPAPTPLAKPSLNDFFLLATRV